MVAHFLKSDIERQAFQAFAKTHLPGHLSAGGEEGEVLLSPNVTVKGNLQEGLSVGYFKHVLCFTTPFHHWRAMHANGALS